MFYIEAGPGFQVRGGVVVVVVVVVEEEVGETRVSG
jgi:hypothetical protein